METIKFLTDEDFQSAILDGVRRRLRDLDIVSVQEAGIRTSRDPQVLEFAASENRILLTHDVRTMETHARARLALGKPMPGVVIIRQQLPIIRAINGIILVAKCSQPEEWSQKIQFLPL